MKRNHTTKQTTKKEPAALKTYRVIDDKGIVVSSFVLSDDHPRATLNISLPGTPLERPVKRLEREAWAFRNGLFETLQEIEKIDEDAAYNLFSELFPPEFFADD